jgi:hypothetical protein
MPPQFFQGIQQQQQHPSRFQQSQWSWAQSQ